MPLHVTGTPARVAVDRHGALHLLTDAGTPDRGHRLARARLFDTPHPGRHGPRDLRRHPRGRPRPRSRLLASRPCDPTASNPCLRSVPAATTDAASCARRPARSPSGPRTACARRSPARVRYVRTGRVTSFRLDADAFQTQWGRIFIDACIPPGTSVRVCCVVADEPPDDAPPRPARRPPTASNPNPRAPTCRRRCRPARSSPEPGATFHPPAPPRDRPRGRLVGLTPESLRHLRGPRPRRPRAAICGSSSS
jgi:hypothetical protein